MSSVKRVSLSAVFNELRDIALALQKPLLVLFVCIASDIVALQFVRGGKLYAAAVDVFAWVFGSGSLSSNSRILEVACLCAAGLLGYVFLGVVVWAMTQALTTAYGSGGLPVRTSKKVIAVTAALLIAVAAVFLAKALMDSRAASSVNPPATELKAVELPISYSAVTHLAQTRGFIANEGLNYRVLSVPAGPDVINALKVRGTDAVNVGSIATTPVAVMVGAGDQPVILATLITSPAQVRLVTFADSRITKDPGTLRGKRVGFVGSTVGEIYLSRLLAMASMTEVDIKAVNGRPADLTALLLRGDIDAAVLWDPFVAQVLRQAETANARGAPQVFVEPGLYNLAFYVVSMRETVDKRRAELIRFLRACVKAGDAIESDRAGAQRDLEAWLGLEAGDLKYFVDTTSFRVQLDPKQVTTDVRAELEWLRIRQPTTMIPDDLGGYVDSSLLASVDASRIVRP